MGGLSRPKTSFYEKFALCSRCCLSRREPKGKKEKKELTEKQKDFNTRAEKITGNKIHHELSNVSEFSKAKAESDLEMLNQILYDYNHLMSLKELFERFDRTKTQMLLTENVDFRAEKDINYYIGSQIQIKCMKIN